LDLLPGDVQPILRGLFRSYLDARLGVYRKLPDVQASGAEQDRARTLQIWSDAVAASALPGAHPDTAKLLLPALDEMIDMTTVILDIKYPRQGLLRADAYHQVLIDLSSRQEVGRKS
jgi:hypothetical protein